MRRVRVAMVGPARNVRGGISAVVNALLCAMPDDAPRILYVPTHVDGPKLLKILAALAGLLRFLWTVIFWRCDIVHIHTSYSASFVRKSAIAALARAFGVKIIIHVHGSQFDLFYENSNAIVKGIIRMRLESADIVIALSDDWLRRLKRMAPAALIRVLPNPVVATEFAPALSGKSDVLATGGDILFLGAFGKRKGVFDLLEAAVRVVEKRPDVVFELGGDQSVDQVRELVQKKNLQETVRVLGWVKGADKVAAFRRAHVYVLPSYHEGLPVSILEAFASGLPVVTTPVGGIPEIVKDGVNGFLVEPGDVNALASAILRLLSDHDLRRTMSATNLDLVRTRHDARVVVRKLVDWYDEIYSGAVEKVD
jgi:glycosyltransferase involved in cell wall biosynthesis